MTCCLPLSNFHFSLKSVFLEVISASAFLHTRKFLNATLNMAPLHSPLPVLVKPQIPALRVTSLLHT